MADLDLAKMGLTANELLALPKKYYPLFDLCHILLCILTVRKEAGKEFAHRNPFSTWLSCIVSSFAGSLLCNPLLGTDNVTLSNSFTGNVNSPFECTGKPMFGAFADEQMVLAATALFALVFFSPGDFFYKLVKSKPFYLPICVIKEIFRAKKIFAGLQDGQNAYPNSPYLIPVTVAVIKGNGSAFMAPFARAIRGSWVASKAEWVSPSVTTKECFMAAVAFAVFGNKDIMYLSFIGLFVSVKLGGILGAPVDPFTPFEQALFAIIDNLSTVESEKKKE